jgi:hypothetical protein
LCLECAGKDGLFNDCNDRSVEEWLISLDPGLREQLEQH